jgi:hypothetical protein
MNDVFPEYKKNLPGEIKKNNPFSNKILNPEKLILQININQKEQCIRKKYC